MAYRNESGIMLNYRLGRILWAIPKVGVPIRWITGLIFVRCEHNVIRDSYWLMTQEQYERERRWC